MIKLFSSIFKTQYSLSFETIQIIAKFTCIVYIVFLSSHDSTQVPTQITSFMLLKSVCLSASPDLPSGGAHILQHAISLSTGRFSLFTALFATYANNRLANFTTTVAFASAGARILQRLASLSTGICIDLLHCRIDRTG